MLRDRLASYRASRIVHSAQELVSSFGPHPNYDAEYRPQETSYWQHLPGWIWQDQRPASRCLDIGPGFGTLMVFSHLATGATAYGLDFDSVYMTDGLQASEGMEWALGNVELDTLPWEGPFDFIVFSEVLEHLNFRAEPTLVALASVLAPEGRIYLSTPDSAEWGVTTKYYDSYDELPLPSEADRDNVVDDHIWQFSRDELMAVITAAGLEVVRFAYAPGTHGRHFNLAAQLTD